MAQTAPSTSMQWWIVLSHHAPLREEMILLWHSEQKRGRTYGSQLMKSCFKNTVTHVYLDSLRHLTCAFDSPLFRGAFLSYSDRIQPEVNLLELFSME